MKLSCGNVRLLVVGCLPLLTGSLWAEPVTPEMASAAADAWLRENPRAGDGDRLSGEEPRAERTDDGSVLWYEVPTAAGGRVITSPDTDVEPIISYVEEWDGPLPADHPLRVLLVADLSSRLAAVRREAAAQSRPMLMVSAPTAARPPTQSAVFRRLSPGRRSLSAVFRRLSQDARRETRVGRET